MTAVATRLRALEQVYGGPSRAERRALAEQLVDSLTVGTPALRRGVLAALLGEGPPCFHLPAALDPDADGGADVICLVVGALTPSPRLYVKVISYDAVSAEPPEPAREPPPPPPPVSASATGAATHGATTAQ